MTTEANTTVITLPKTKLSVAAGRLTLRSPSDQTISDIDMNSITSVTVRMETDWVMIIFPIGLFAIAGACKWYIASPALGWFLCVVIGAVGLLSVLGLKRPLLTIQTKDGQVTFDIKDTPQETEAFALSLRQQTNQRPS